MRDLLLEACTRVLERHGAEAQAARASGTCAQSLWAALAEAGFPHMLSGPAAADGPGLADGLALIARAAAFATPVPLAETMLAGFLLGRSGCAVPDGPLSLVVAAHGSALRLERQGETWRLAGTARRVPWARNCASLAVVAQSHGTNMIALADLAAAEISQGANLAGEPRDDVHFDQPVLPRLSPFSPQDAWALGALVRSAQMTGAVSRIVAIAIDHAATREQFGRPLIKFQAISHAIAELGCHQAAAVAALAQASERAESEPSALALPFAKIRVGEAAGEAAAVAHQILGAMGYTLEHELQSHSRRVWSWRDEFGTAADWSRMAGRLLCAAGAERFWPLIVGARA